MTGPRAEPRGRSSAARGVGSNRDWTYERL